MKLKSSNWLAVVVASLITVGCGGPLEEDSEGAAETNPVEQEAPSTEEKTVSAQACLWGNPVHVGTTIRTGNYIKGSGYTTCDSARVKIQRRRWWGWEEVASRGVGATAITVSYNCRGQGTYTYRTQTRLETGPYFQTATSNEITVTC